MSFQCPYCNFNDNVKRFPSHYIEHHCNTCEHCKLLYCPLEIHLCKIKTIRCRFCNISYNKVLHHDCKIEDLKRHYKFIDEADMVDMDLQNAIHMRILLNKLMTESDNLKN